METKEELLDEFVSSLSKIIEIKDDIQHDLRYHNSNTASSIRENRYIPEIEKLKGTLRRILSLSTTNNE